MTTLRSRLGKLTPALSARQRFLLMLRARNTGAPDPDVKRTMPHEQYEEFRVYARLWLVANGPLAAVLGVVEVNVHYLEQALGRLSELDQAAALLVRDLGEELPKEVRAWRSRKHVTVPQFLQGLAGDLRAELREDLSGCWAFLRGVERLWAELAAEFDGEEVVDAKPRATAAALRERVLRLADALPRGRTLLREPSAEQLQQLRDELRQWYTYLGWTEFMPEVDDKKEGRR